jgi:hypothetical protein
MSDASEAGVENAKTNAHRSRLESPDHGTAIFKANIRTCGWDNEPRLEEGFAKKPERHNRKF